MAGCQAVARLQTYVSAVVGAGSRRAGPISRRGWNRPTQSTHSFRCLAECDLDPPLSKHSHTTVPSASLQNAPWCIHILLITEDRSSSSIYMCHFSLSLPLSLSFFRHAFLPVWHRSSQSVLLFFNYPTIVLWHYSCNCSITSNLLCFSF